jgi:hypothetical protein
MDNNSYVVTHVFLRPAEEKGWVKLTYLVKREGKYYQGEKSNRPFDEKGLEKLSNTNALIELKNPVRKLDNQTLWLTPEYEVYLASKSNPQGKDEKSTFICDIGV